ncbi:hypothetical protein BH10ACI2_BH10ACI2_19430 [soil metagenome]
MISLMQHRFLLPGCVVVIALAVSAVTFPDGAVGIGMVFSLSSLAIFILRRYTDEKEFITNIFLLGLALRMGFGVIIYIFDLQSFFGGDFVAYDTNGMALSEFWLGHNDLTQTLLDYNNPISGAGWGMNYLTGVIYFVLGHNLFAAQSFCAVIGASTPPLVYYCSNKIYNNTRVSKSAAIAVALFPSFIIWSGQLLKDGLIVFLLVLAMTMVLELQRKFGYGPLVLLIMAMFGILSLRFYIFYMVAVAVAGSFIVGLSSTKRSIIRSTIILALVGLALSYLGVGRQANVEIPTFVNLDRIQASRSDLARSAGSGFGEELDVSTTEGALTALPIGFTYLMLAPFPWQAANIRQAITIPEILVWYGMIPFIISGLIYTIKNKLRNAFPILIFSLMLTIAYSVFQGNVGTAYRQRTQIQVFLFILIGVGWTVYQEKRENKRILQEAERKQMDVRLAARRKAINT